MAGSVKSAALPKIHRRKCEHFLRLQTPKNEGRVCPHLVNSTPDLCCDIHEWPVEPLRGRTNFFAYAAFFTLRAHAAQNHNDRVGLIFLFLCALYGAALLAITTAFWAACWTLPIMETRKALITYTISAVVFFPMFWVVSSLGSLGATGSDISKDLVQGGYIDQLDNTSQSFALYASEIDVIRAGMLERADQAFDLEASEIAGDGPTGVSAKASWALWIW